MTQIAVMVGSLRRQSFNLQFAQALEKRLPEDVNFKYLNLDLPLFNEDIESTSYPAAADEMKRTIDEADGLLIVTPEYNRSFSGVLKNAIDWASRPYGTKIFDHKPVSIAGVSVSALGTTQAQSHLRNVLLHLNADVLGQPEAYLQASAIFDDNGLLKPDAESFVDSYIEAMVEHVRR
ncbi:hypothetical protein B7Y94_05705 [Candidatus Saccharibacteria bacterium 32-49-12]|nr:MAG: hypothetical protein B7Y94_05705 [Candidatus Saccharibacteria bacterium 32-49-12]